MVANGEWQGVFARFVPRRMQFGLRSSVN